MAWRYVIEVVVEPGRLDRVRRWPDDAESDFRDRFFDGVIRSALESVVTNSKALGRKFRYSLRETGEVD